MVQKHGLDVKIVQQSWRPTCSNQQLQELWISCCTCYSTSHSSDPARIFSTHTTQRFNLGALASGGVTAEYPHPLLRVHDSGVKVSDARWVTGFHLFPRLGLTALLQQKKSSLNSQRDVMLKEQIAVAKSEVCQSWDFQKQLMSQRCCIPVNPLNCPRCCQTW